MLIFREVSTMQRNRKKKETTRNEARRRKIRCTRTCAAASAFDKRQTLISKLIRTRNMTSDDYKRIQNARYFLINSFVHPFRARCSYFRTMSIEFQRTHVRQIGRKVLVVVEQPKGSRSMFPRNSTSRFSNDLVASFIYSSRQLRAISSRFLDSWNTRTDRRHLKCYQEGNGSEVKRDDFFSISLSLEVGTSNRRTLFPYLSHLRFTNHRDLISSRRRSFLTNKLARSWVSQRRWQDDNSTRCWLLLSDDFDDGMDFERRTGRTMVSHWTSTACTYILRRTSRSSKNGKLTHLSSVNSVRVGSAVTVQLNSAAVSRFIRDIGGVRRFEMLKSSRTEAIILMYKDYIILYDKSYIYITYCSRTLDI